MSSAYRKSLMTFPFTIITSCFSERAFLKILSDYTLKSKGDQMQTCLTPLFTKFNRIVSIYVNETDSLVEEICFSSSSSDDAKWGIMVIKHFISFYATK